MSKRKKTNQTAEKSFTLIETLVTVGVFTLMLTMTSGFIMKAYQVYGYTWRQSLVIAEARRGVETMIKEIREARQGENGSYPIERAGDKEFIFYSDTDNDGQTERVRYFYGTVSSGSQTQNCVTFSRGGSCSVNFANFYTGTPKTAQLKVSVEGDLGNGNEYAQITADGITLGNLCRSGCSDCAATWQGTTIYDVTTAAADNALLLVADATSTVDPICNWQEPNHALKAQFELSWTEEISDAQHELKKGVIKPAVGTGGKIEYPPDQERITVLSRYIRNAPPIFEYFDADGNKITDYPARLADTKVMKVYLIVNADPNRPPDNFELESSVQLRNLKSE